MFRYALAALAAVVLVGASLIPDDAFARRGGGGYRGGGYHGGGAHYRGGAVHAGRYGGRYGVAGRGYRYHPVARTAVRRGVYRGAAYGAAAGAAAAGAYGYYGGYNSGYNSGCYQNAYGAWVCPRQYQY